MGGVSCSAVQCSALSRAAGGALTCVALPSSFRLSCVHLIAVFTYVRTQSRPSHTRGCQHNTTMCVRAWCACVRDLRYNKFCSAAGSNCAGTKVSYDKTSIACYSSLSPAQKASHPHIQFVTAGGTLCIPPQQYVFFFVRTGTIVALACSFWLRRLSARQSVRLRCAAQKYVCRSADHPRSTVELNSHTTHRATGTSLKSEGRAAWVCCGIRRHSCWAATS